MDLIYANASYEDIGVLKSYDLDVDLGLDNTFALTTDLSINPLQNGYLIYIDGTEYGGIIDSLKIETKKSSAVYSGRTWRGLLGSKIIIPLAGDDYYSVSGDANDVIAEIIQHIGLLDLFEGSELPSDITVTDYSFSRYVDAYTGLRAMLDSVGAKLHLAWNTVAKKVTVTAVESVDYSDSHEVNSDQIDFSIQKMLNIPNHVIGLGQGELSARMVIHRYIDANGNISTVPYYTGAKEWTIVHDEPNAESEDELIEASVEDLLEAYTPAVIKVNVSDIELDIDDRVTARDIATNIVVTAKVVNKIVQISNGYSNISYKVE